MRGLKKSTFEKSIDSLSESDFEKLSINISKFTGDCTKNGTLGSSRKWLGIQSIMIDGLASHKNTLKRILEETDPVHTGIKKGDFVLAKRSLEKLRNNLELDYSRRADAAKAFGATPEFDSHRFDRELQNMKMEIQLLKSHFLSKRSFLKRVISEFEKHIIKLVLVVIVGGGFAYALKALERFSNFF